MNDGQRLYPVDEGFLHHSVGPEFKTESALTVQDWFSSVGKQRGYNNGAIRSFHEHPGRPGVETYSMAHLALRQNVSNRGNGYDGWELIELIKNPWNQVAWHCGNWNHNRKSIGIEVCGDYRTQVLPDIALKLIGDYFRPQDQKLGGKFTIWAHKWTFPTACPANLVNQINRVVEFINGATIIPVLPPLPPVVPVAPPAPVPVITPQLAPSYVNRFVPLPAPVHYVLNKDANLWDFNYNTWSDFASLGLKRAGEEFVAVGFAEHKIGSRYYMDEAAFTSRKTIGINIADLSLPQPAPTPVAISEPEKTPSAPLSTEVEAPVAEPEPAAVEVPIKHEHKMLKNLTEVLVTDLNTGEAVETIPPMTEVPIGRLKTVGNNTYVQTPTMVEETPHHGIELLQFYQVPAAPEKPSVNWVWNLILNVLHLLHRKEKK